MCGDACTSTSTAKFFAMRTLHCPAPCVWHTLLMSAMRRHPHVVSVYSVEQATGRILLEYIHGRTLGEELKGGAVSGVRAMCVAEQVLQGVAHLHSYGCVHGDINPSNVLVHAESGACKIGDYFAASPRHGAPAYMAPEAVRQKPTCLSDAWSCGCVMLRLEGLNPWQDAEVELEDGTRVSITEVAALLYHLSCREVAMHGPPECEHSLIFRAFIGCIFRPPESRASVVELLEQHARCSEL